jgi:carboxypeptidase family protein
VAFRIILLTFAAAAILDAQPDQCQIRGEVTDTSHATIPSAVIRVFANDSMSPVFRGDYYKGTFCIKDLSPGTYTVKAWRNGFRANRVHDVVVRSGETTNIGAVQLEVVGCDAREIECCLQVATLEVAATQPAEPVEIVRTDLSLHQACGADLSKGKALCSDPLGQDVDMVFVEDHGTLLLRPVNGARMDSDCKGVYRDQALLIEALGAGDDLCIKTRNGHTSHVFFEGGDVLPSTTELKLWIVTKE